MEQKAQQMLDMSAAESELNTTPKDEAEELSQKYGSTGSASVDEELARLKAEMGH